MQLQSGKEEWLAKEIDSEHRLTSLQSQLQGVTSEMRVKSSECDELREKLAQREAKEKDGSERVKVLEEAEDKRRQEVEKLSGDIERLEADVENCEKGSTTLHRTCNEHSALCFLLG